MRFTEDGPSIPDELLLARDQGRVVFFCGAGVSRAKAGLPDFFGLAERIIEKLGIPADSPAQKILNEAREIDKRTGVTGLISVDRIFGLLERDFLMRDVEEAVASALKTDIAPDLTAHQTLLDLATTPEGAVRLVTTNFDRLFDDCDRNLTSWKPPRLPNPLRAKEMHGIVYLHGRANQDYSGAENGGFILSSSQFGRAYLSEGWATSFVKEIIDQYTVIFIGYSADDPPIHYLLEALNKPSGKNKIYAFQSGSKEESQARWLHKGVEAIAYDSIDKHRLLWQSLEAWAERARDSDQWYSAVIDKAKQGPKKLLPHERGQVAHIVSTVEGLRKFSEGDEPPPAEWLCVFDRQRRYAPPRRTGTLTEPGPYIDPFLLYHLDADVRPEQIDPEMYDPDREVPDAWDAFFLNRVDKLNLTADKKGLRFLSENALLSRRLDQLFSWIANVSHQPAVLWWAVRQHVLHPSLVKLIRWRLEDSGGFVNSELHLAWHYLLEYWEQSRVEFRHAWYSSQKEIKQYGWSQNLIRRYSSCFRPYVAVGNQNNILPPNKEEKIDCWRLIQLNVAYPDFIPDVAVPAEWLPAFAVALRRNLEISLSLETEIDHRYELKHIPPISPNENSDQHNRTHGLAGAVFHFSSVFEQLVQADFAAAKREFLKWPIDDDTIFARLRIWAASKAELIPNDQFESIIDNLSDTAFWDIHHQRDLLFTLSARWNTLNADTRSKIEKRLLAGRLRWAGEDKEEFKERRARTTLNRINWLGQNECQFQFNLEAETKRLQEDAPEWRSQYADSAAKSLDKEPYAGLSKVRPVRAFAALRLSAKQQEFPEWDWRTFFLDIEARKNDKPKFVAFIAEQLARYPKEVFSPFLWSVAYWLLNVSKDLAVNYPETFDRVISKLIDTLAVEPKSSSSATVQSGKEPNWITKANSAPTGNIAESLFKDPRTDSLKAGSEFQPDWLRHVEALLALHGELRCHALAIFAKQINWFYRVNPDWTEKNLLSVLNADIENEIDAFWAGFLWSKEVNQELYLLLKPCFLQFAKSDRVARQGLDGSVAGMMLFGWGRLACISDDELRDVLTHNDDEFRSHILWKAKIWASESKRLKEWMLLLSRLLKDVWPRQKKFKTSKISEKLCNVAFSNDRLFQNLSDIIPPLLTKINGQHLMLLNVRIPKEQIIEQYPDKVLTILHAVMSDDISYWPHDIEDTFNRIGQADNSLNSDERLIELRRKWNSR